MIARFLFRLTADRPCRLIRRDGDHPYLERYWIGRLFGVSVCLHRFVGGDVTEETHDHPYRAVSIGLSGEYEEERVSQMKNGGWCSSMRLMRPLRISRIGPDTFHRITRVLPETWTLFLHGRRNKEWGFLDIDESGAPWYRPHENQTPDDWWRTAPKGRDAGREPFRGGGNAGSRSVLPE